MKNTMRYLKLALLSGVAAATAAAQPVGFYAELGASYLSLHGERFERSPEPLQTLGGKAKTAPFVTAGYRLDEGLSVRLSYHAIGDIEAAAKFGSPPNQGGPVNTPVVVWGRYEDEVHLLTLAPEFSWPRGKWTFRLAPEVNWVSSRGRASYTMSDPTIAAIPPRTHSENGFTLGGALAVSYAIAERTSVSLTYHYTDLDPSFDREAHVFSAGVRWGF